jgi:hypothetical protein
VEFIEGGAAIAVEPAVLAEQHVPAALTRRLNVRAAQG